MSTIRRALDTNPLDLVHRLDIRNDEGRGMSEERKTGAPGLYDELFTEELAELSEAQGYITTVSKELTEPKVVQSAVVPIKQYLNRLTTSLVDTLGERPNELWDAIASITDSALPRLPDELRRRFTLRTPARLLQHIRGPKQPANHAALLPPLLPLTRSQLLANRYSTHDLAKIISSELQSADEVDVIMAFIRSPGVELLRESLQFAIDRGVRVRMLTSVYFRGSEAVAIETLHKMGVELRIDLSHKTSDVHAKGWLFRRHSGYSTAIVGSSNISAKALRSGREWNIRISEREVPHLIQGFDNVFEHAWNQEQFVAYDPTAHSDLLHDSLRKEQFEQLLSPQTGPIVPRPHQEDALGALNIERETFGHHRNLVVSATGTGKTVTSALDYARLCEPGKPRPTLLYVAHRQEILRQARDTFRRVLGDQSFGELWVGEHQPVRHTHLFAGIQLIARRELARQQWSPDTFDVVIIDEFHHAAAESYRALLDELQPKQTIGLTATPDRLDGQDITQFFDGRTAYSLRLWDALDDELLTPFQYFGVTDDIDLGTLGWRRNQYDATDLENAFIGNDARMATILSAIRRYIDEPDTMRALGFCVSVAHAEDMAKQFTANGLPAAHLSGSSSQEERQAVVANLVSGEIRAIFTADLFNEGVDIPSVDTILFLRPTQSVTLFTQQLGRGLRLAEGKEHCVVLDFIGRHRAEYGYENVYQVFTPNDDAAYALENGFPDLPKGCLVHLEPIVREQILQKLQLKRSSKQGELFDEDGRPLGLPAVLEQSQLTLDEFYRKKRFEGGLAAEQHKQLHARQQPLFSAPHTLSRSAQPSLPFSGVAELLKPEKSTWDLRVSALSHLDDDLRLNALRNLGLLRHEENHRLLNRMLLSRLAHSYDLPDHSECLKMISASPLLQKELVDLADTLAHTKRRALKPFGPPSDAILSIHATYSRIEVSAALFELTSSGRVHEHRTGVYYNHRTNQDIFFVTINKDESRFSPSTRYDDAPLSKSRFRWQSQNSASLHTSTGKRYTAHESQMLLFARAHGKIANVTQNFYFLGPVTPLSHEGEKPITFIFELEHPMPQAIFHDLQIEV